MGKISASEAVLGFMGWLTTRDETLMISANHVCGPAADVVKEFCDANNWPAPRPGCTKWFVHPSSKDNK